MHRPENVGRLPRAGEVLLAGLTADGKWKSVRIPRRYRWLRALMVGGFIRYTAVDRLAILIGEGTANDGGRIFLLTCVDRAGLMDDAQISDRRLARLAQAAKRAWSKAEPREPVWFGRPWQITLLTFALSVELLFGILRVPLLVSGRYSWLPMIPRPVAAVLFLGYMLLIAAAIVLLWRQARLGYILALALSVVQFVRPIALVADTADPSRYYLGLVWSWSLPALIWLALGLLYWARRRGRA